MFLFIIGAVIGGAIMYAVKSRWLPTGATANPQNAAEFASARVRDVAGVVQKQAGNAAGKVYGTVQEVVHKPDNPTPDDGALKERVQTEIFRDPETSRANINVGVVNGVVTLRGELPHPEDINALIARVQSIPNVRDVQSYLHLPNTVAPNKQEVIDAPKS